ncbi:MAG: glycosyltransferase family 2 protein [Flavobacteriales bacterium]|nr:glycosyltransferase family 2 protein [Flavobacteriales bacterium]
MSSSGAARVTVVMTLYNKAEYVGEAIRSVLAQSMSSFELLIIDDASPDTSLFQVRRFEDARIRVIANPVNLGRSGAANRGYEEARGEYIAILDADDIMMPERLAVQVAFMDAHPEIGVSGTFVQQFGVTGRISRWPVEDAQCKGRMFFTDPVCYGSSIIRTDLLHRTRIRSDADWRLPGEDYLLMLRLGGHTRFANIPEVLTHYRIGEQNQRHGRDAFSDRSAICKEAFKLMGIPISEEELRVHLLFFLIARGRITTGMVRSFHAWIERLGEINRSRGLFPSAEFEDEMWRRWGRLFYLLPEHGLASALAWLRLSRKRPKDWFTYLLKTTLTRWTGRAQNTR